MRPNRVAMLAIALLLLPVAMTHDLEAAYMTSETYSVDTDVISVGGARSISESFYIEDTIGEPFTGEDATSETFATCAGFQCVGFEDQYITFSVTEGLSSPGTAGLGVDLGAIDPFDVTGSDGTNVRSVFLAFDTNAGGGVAITVRSENEGLDSALTAGSLPSASADLSGTSGYGICIGALTQDTGSPSGASPYNGTCDQSSNHNVGIVDSTNRNVVTSTAGVTGGEAEILVKAKAAGTTSPSDDYTDTLTFIISGTF